MEKPEPKASHALRFGLFGTDQADKVPGSVIEIQVRRFNIRIESSLVST
jgi:hypothetical protein